MAFSSIATCATVAMCPPARLRPRLATLLGPATERSRLPRPGRQSSPLIADGRIPPGTRLPSERELTGALDDRTTVTRAYAVLKERGYLSSRRGSGSEAALPYRQRREIAAAG